MIGGFIGTLIGLERAIGFARWWAYAAPVASAFGVVALAAGHMTAGPILITIASASVSAVFIAVVVMEPALFSATMLAGSVCWFVGNLLWTAGFAIYRVVLWWIAFIVLTIAGERLELNRLLRPRPAVRAAFVVIADLVDELGRYRAWGGLLNAAALLLFVVNTVASTVHFSSTASVKPSVR